MRIELLRLMLVNFKGARNVIVDFSIRTALIGRNETGKTTLFDAWYWLLFGKDSAGKQEFGIKTTDPEGNALHGLDHSVEGTLRIDGKRVLLKKVYKENWVKKRGSADSEFSGHTTSYFVDEVPVKQKEYKDFIDSLVNEDTFRLLTDPMYFNVQMSWQQRRALLLEVCGDISNADVISANESLAKLPVILGDRSVEDHRKVLSAKRKTINEELDKLPVRIDEAERSKPDTDGLSQTELQAEIDQLKFEVESKEAEITRLQSGEQVVALQNRTREIEGELAEIKNRAQSDVFAEIVEKRKVVAQFQAEKEHLDTSIQRIDRSIESTKADADVAYKKAQELRADWVKVNGETFQHIGDDTCAACGQALPAEKVQEAHDQALSIFNQRKSKWLEEIAEKGKQAKMSGDGLVVKNQELEVERAGLLEKCQTAEKSWEAAKSQLTTLESQVQDVSADTEYAAKKREMDEVSTKIAALRQSSLNEVQKVRTALMDTRDELRRKEAMLARFEQVKSLDIRIEELRAQERTLAAEFERLEEERFLTEEFIKSKVQMLESRINSKFEITRFKLFKEQVNGGLEECCVALHKGVAYDAGLNTGGRILVGLDIIRTLQRHYGIYAPVWVDNDESLTSDVDMDCQLIELIASRKDKVLRVEHAEREAV